MIRTKRPHGEQHVTPRVLKKLLLDVAMESYVELHEHLTSVSRVNGELRCTLSCKTLPDQDEFRALLVSGLHVAVLDAVQPLVQEHVQVHVVFPSYANYIRFFKSPPPTMGVSHWLNRMSKSDLPPPCIVSGAWEILMTAYPWKFKEAMQLAERAWTFRRPPEVKILPGIFDHLLPPIQSMMSDADEEYLKTNLKKTLGLKEELTSLLETYEAVFSSVSQHGNTNPQAVTVYATTFWI